jgi:hypothetical protein
MTSTAIPQADQALLEAQAQAGPAGVKAYEAARTQLEQQQQTTLAQAAEAATARGGPAGAMGHALSVADDTYQRRLDSLTQAQATQERQYASREQRMGDYNQAVLGARDLIGAQAAAAAQPVKLRSDLEIAKMQQGADSSVRSIEANMRLMEAEAAAQMRAAEQAARLEQERWEREMAQRERLAAESRAAAGGGDPRLALDNTQLANVLRQSGVERLDAVVGAVGTAMTEGQLAKAVEDYTRDAVQGPYAERDAAITVYEKFFPKPVSADYQKNGRTDQYAWMKALDEWRANANRWRDEGPSKEDFTNIVQLAQRRYRPEINKTTVDLNAFRQAQAAIQAEKARAGQATTSGRAGLAELGLKSSDELARSPEWLNAITAQLRAADPMVAEYIKMAGAAGKIRTPDDMARALGMTDLEPYTPPPNPYLTTTGVANQVREWEKTLPNQSIMEQAIRTAMAEGLQPISEQYKVHQGDLISAMAEQNGLTYLDLTRNEDIGARKRIQDAYDATKQGFEDQESEEWEAYNRERTLLEHARQDEAYAMKSPQVAMDAVRAELEAKHFNPDLLEAEIAKRNLDTAESIGGTEGQQDWSTFTGMFPLSDTPFTSHAAGKEWLDSRPQDLPDALSSEFEGTPESYKKLLMGLMLSVQQEPNASGVSRKLNELGFYDEPDGTYNSLIYRIVMGAQGAAYDPLSDYGDAGLRP